MKAKAFDELIASVREAGNIKRGKKAPSRRFEFKPADVRKIRLRSSLSQPEFAFMIAVGVATPPEFGAGSAPSGRTGSRAASDPSDAS